MLNERTVLPRPLMTEKFLDDLAASGDVHGLKKWRFAVMRAPPVGKRFSLSANEALLTACWEGSLEKLHLAIKRGANVNLPGDKMVGSKFHGSYPLHLASRKGHAEVVEYLLKEKKVEDVCRDASGWTPLTHACEKGYLNIVTLLVENFTDSHNIFLKTNTGKSPLMWACQNGHVDIVAYLLQKGAAVEVKSYDGTHSLHSSIALGHTGVVEALFKRGANASAMNEKTGQSPLMVASKYGRTKCIVQVLKNLLKQEDPIEKIFNANNPEYVEPINRTDLEGKSPLILACENGHLDTVRLLLDNGADIDKPDIDTGATSLITAAKHGRSPIIRLLLKRGASTELLCDFGWTALMWACASKHIPAARLLNPANIAAAKRIMSLQSKRGVDSDGSTNDSSAETEAGDGDELNDSPKVSTAATEDMLRNIFGKR